MGTNPVFALVPDGAQVDDLLHVFPAALDFEQLLAPTAMSSADRFGSAVRSRYFPSRFSSAFAFAASILSRPPEVTRR